MHVNPPRLRRRPYLFSFQTAEPKLEGWENMIVIIIVLKELYKYFRLCKEFYRS